MSDQNAMKVVPKTQESSDEVPVTMMPSSVTATDEYEVSAQATSSSKEVLRDELRRRTSHQHDEFDEDQH